jgi:hypothetical protein
VEETIGCDAQPASKKVTTVTNNREGLFFIINLLKKLILGYLTTALNSCPTIPILVITSTPPPFIKL